MMELRQVIKEEVLEALHEQTQMLKEQRIILAPWRSSIYLLHHGV